MDSVPAEAQLDSRVLQLQSWDQDPALATQYSSVYDALARLIDPPGASNLFKAAQATANLAHNVPWLLAELTPAYPALEHLPDLARDISTVEREEIQGKGYASHRVLVALKDKDADPCDQPLRALVLALAARKPLEPKDPPRLSAIDRCIDAISSAIGGLYHLRTKAGKKEPSPLLPLLANCADAESLDEYVHNLKLDLSPDHHKSLETRVRLDLQYALGLDDPPPAPGPSGPGTGNHNDFDLPVDPSHPDGHVINLSLSPVDEAPDPEPDEESRPTVTVAGLDGKRGRPVSHGDLLDAARAAGRPQDIRHANDLLLDLHVDVLTEPEAKLLAPEITHAGIGAARSGATDAAVRLSIASLVLALGYDTKRAAALLIAKRSEDQPYLSPDRAYVISPALQPPNAFSPAVEDQDLFAATAPNVRIPLPPPIVELLKALPLGKLRRFPLHAPHKDAWKAVGGICREHGLLAVTNGRIRRTCSARLYEHCRDLPAVMHLTRDTFGASLAPMYYCCLDESYLQQIYRGAIWSIWDYKTEEGKSSESRRIGSKGFVPPGQAKKVAHSIGAAFQRGIPDNPDRNGLIRLHNTLMAHTTGMMMSVVGHRPVDALFGLTAHDFDLHIEAAIVRDKQIDAAHMHRLVALGSRAAAQIGAYMDHLEAIRSKSALPAQTRAEVEGALSGTQPLFFRLSSTGEPEEMSIARWRDMRPNAWKRVPTNWGRHYLASEGRNLEISPELVHVQLGHLESAGYPFSPDSPLEPLLYVNRMRSVLDNIFRSQGWSCRRTVEPGQWRDAWQATGGLHKWEAELERQAAWVKAERAKLRHQYRAQQLSIREWAEDIVIRQARHLDEHLGALIAYRIHELRRRRAPVAQNHCAPHSASIETNLSCPDHVGASAADIMGLLDSIDGDCNGNEALNIAARNTIARCLRWAARQRCYTGLVPGFWLFRAPADPASFLASHLQATRQIRLLRTLCTEAFKSSRFESDIDYRLGILLLSTIVHGGIDDHRSLDILRSSDTLLLGVPALGDAILASSPSGGQIGLRQTAALCYSVLHRDFLSQDSLSLNEIEAAISMVVPDGAFNGNDLLEPLLQTMQICNRVERSGMANLALDANSGSIALPQERLMELLGHDAHTPLPTGDTVIKPPSPNRQNRAQRDYLDIKRVWPNKMRDIHLPRTGETVELMHRQDPSRKRRVYEELVAMSQAENRTFLGRSLAGWLAWELIKRKPNDNDFRKYGGVYSGFTEIGSRLTFMATDFPEDLDSSELEEIYLDAVNSAAATNSRRLARSVKDYHQYLTTYHGADPISTTEINLAAGSRATDDVQIDNQIFLPQEETSASGLLQHSAYDAVEPVSRQYVNYRILRQIVIIFILLAATGARVSEILGLRRRDFILIRDGSYLFIRSTGFQSVKTPHARRLINLGQWMLPRHKAAFEEWIESEESMGNIHGGASMLFAELDSRPLSPHVVRRGLKACYELCSNRALKNHHLRHTAISDAHCWRETGVSLHNLGTQEVSIEMDTSLRMPRDLQRDTRQHGHKLPRTGIQYYMHAPWVFALHAQSAATHQADRHTLAACLGVLPSAADNRKQQHGNQAVLNAIRSIAPVLEAKRALTTRATDSRVTLPAQTTHLSKYVDACGRGVANSHAARTFGLVAAEVEALHAAAQVLTDHADIELIPGIGLASSAGRAAPRWYGKSKQLQEIWDAVEQQADSSYTWMWIAEQWYAHRMRSDHGQIRLPRTAASELESALSAWGYTCTMKRDIRSDALVWVKISHPSTERPLQYIVTWVLAIAWVVTQARHQLCIPEHQP